MHNKDLPIFIETRDINGHHSVLHLATNSDVLEAVEDGRISEDDETLIVAKFGLVLYSALSSENELTINDLTGFFA